MSDKILRVSNIDAMVNTIKTHVENEINYTNEEIKNLAEEKMNELVSSGTLQSQIITDKSINASTKIMDGTITQELLDDNIKLEISEENIKNLAGDKVNELIASGEIIPNNLIETLDKHTEDIAALKIQDTTFEGNISSLNERLHNLEIEVGTGSDSDPFDFDNNTVVRSVSATVDESIVKQDYLGGYIEIQPDSWDGETTSVDSTTKTWGFPVSLLHSEQARIKNTILKGDGKNIMYIRFPLGFGYRGFRNIDDTTKLAKNIGERFKGQNSTLKLWFENISNAGGGLAPEYWCPAPYWVTSGSYSSDNQLRAGGSYPMTTTLASIKTTDETRYNAQIDAFTDAIVDDLEYLHNNIAPIRMFGLQNEPRYSNQKYGACKYDAQTYNDVLSVLYPKIQASEILSKYNDEENEVKLIVASSDESSPFSGIAATFIANHSDWIWGYSHHSMRKASGESYAGGAEWYKTSEFSEIKGNKSNVFINEYEYFSTTFGTDEFRCSNNMLHLINESVYGEAKVLHPVIHICKPLGQTMSSTNTKGYCLFEANLKGDYGVEILDSNNINRLNKGTTTTNPTMYNSWAMFGDNLPIGSYLVGDYTSKIEKAGWCTYKYDGKLYIFMANNSNENVSIELAFDCYRMFKGKYYTNKYCGAAIKNKDGVSIKFVIPPYSGQVWTEILKDTTIINPEYTIPIPEVSEGYSAGYVNDEGTFVESDSIYTSNDYLPTSSFTGIKVTTQVPVKNIRIVEYDASKQFISKTYGNIVESGKTSGIFALTINTSYIRVGFDLKNGTTEIDPIFSGYAVSKYGDNTSSTLTYTLKGIDISTGEETDANNKIATDYIDVSGKTSFNVKVDVSHTELKYNLRYYDASKNYLSGVSDLAASRTHTPPQNCSYIRLLVVRGKFVSANEFDNRVIIVDNVNYTLQKR